MLLSVVAGCRPSEPSNSNRAPSKDGNGQAAAQDEVQPADKKEPVQLPDDPFFIEFAYPDGTAMDVLTVGNATSVWFKTTDDIVKVADFYNTKYADGNNHVEAEKAYFTQTKPEGGGHGATVTKQPDGSTQIILKLEQPPK